jgi:elongation factor Ts
MPDFTAADVKRLRDATGAGMMDAKKALDETGGDFDRAIEVLRIKGSAKAAKRGAERTASNGLVAAHGSALVELACETDFVAKGADLQNLAADIATAADAARAGDVETLQSVALADGRTVAAAVEAAAMVIGEKIELRHVAAFDGEVVTYLHRRASDLPPQVGVMVEYTGGDAGAARAAAMRLLPCARSSSRATRCPPRSSRTSGGSRTQRHGRKAGRSRRSPRSSRDGSMPTSGTPSWSTSPRSRT